MIQRFSSGRPALVSVKGITRCLGSWATTLLGDEARIGTFSAYYLWVARLRYGWTSLQNAAWRTDEGGDWVQGEFVWGL